VPPVPITRARERGSPLRELFKSRATARAPALIYWIAQRHEHLRSFIGSRNGTNTCAHLLDRAQRHERPARLIACAIRADIYFINNIRSRKLLLAGDKIACGTSSTFL